MEKLYFTSSLQQIDEYTQSHFKLSSELLMESAGAQIAQRIAAKLHRMAHPRIYILTGGGHNGGDGWVVARYLHLWSFDVRVIDLAGGLKPLTQSQCDRAKLFGVKVEGISEFEKSLFSDAQGRKHSLVAIDALLGSGATDVPLSGDYLKAIDLSNSRSDIIRIAIDGPTGLNWDTGTSRGKCFRADWTLSIGFNKPGFFLESGPENVGRLSLVKLSFPALDLPAISTVRAVDASAHLKKVSNTANKSTNGRAAILSGSRGMSGAAVLAARAAVRAGAGYVLHYGRDLESSSAILSEIPSALTQEFQSIENLLQQKFDALLLGPGFRMLSPQDDDMFLSLLGFTESKAIAVVLDAEAFKMLKAPRRLGPHVVLTPHPGEMASLLGCEIDVIVKDRLSAAKEIAERFACWVVAKGYRTLIVNSSGDAKVVLSGGPQLAKAGSGDVLAGILVSLLAQGYPMNAGIELGVFAHGFASELWLKNNGSVRSLEPQDIIETLPECFKRLERRPS
ncbi:MAG: hypothetical protein COT74_13440 [Bdellovibrionales bacterium CG10_big_fil_rev_8_21_14_0_10_45_34]|nr:MAG: hypothetical protein COT74_13440 [Bdellovibrionales bacterium CG10_big_fil_rev_8_21_14_0_10_45_34]